MDADRFIAEVSGCGLFQFWLTAAVCVIRIAPSWVLMTMTFGSYNPGWDCLETILTPPPHPQIYEQKDENSTYVEQNDLNTSSNFNDSFLQASTDLHKLTNGTTALMTLTSESDTCDIYRKCSNIKFRPGAHTVVSEWGLVCDKAWIPPTMISLQMIGSTLSTTVCGVIADRYGRKTSLYIWIALTTLGCLLATFAVSWQMLMAVLFFLGIGMGGNMSLSLVYALEFVNGKWRSIITGLPFWPIVCCIQGFIFMWLRNWRHIYLATTCTGVFALLTFFCVPESFRWLLTNGQEQKANKIAMDMCRVNKVDISDLDPTCLVVGERIGRNSVARKSTIVDVFKSKYWKKEVLLCVFDFFLMVAYYAIGFGIGGLFGDFYTNYIICSIIQIPVYLVGSSINNKGGRKCVILLFQSITVVCCIVVLVVNSQCSGDSCRYLITFLALSMNGLLGFSTTAFNNIAMELFPTQIRIMGFTIALSVGRVGSIIAPYILRPEFGGMTVSFTFLGVAMVLSSWAMMALPETRKKGMESSFNHKRGDLKSPETTTNRIIPGIDGEKL